MNVSERIDELLKERNMSRRQAALKAGIPPSSFQSAMQRNGSMTIEMLEKIAGALGCNIADIIKPDDKIKISIDVNDADIENGTDLKSDPEYFSAFIDNNLSEFARSSVRKREEFNIQKKKDRKLSQSEFDEMVNLFKVGYLAAQGIYPETTDVFSGFDISPNVIRFVQTLIELSPEARENILYEVANLGSRLSGKKNEDDNAQKNNT